MHRFLSLIFAHYPDENTLNECKQGMQILRHLMAIVVVALQELFKPEPMQTNLKIVDQRSEIEKKMSEDLARWKIQK